MMATTPETQLAKSMREIAATGHHRAAELREKADAFDEAAAGVIAGKPETTKRMLGAWARARRLFCEVMGVPLV